LDAYNPDRAPAPGEWLGLDENERLASVSAYHRREHIPVANDRLHAAIHVVVETQIAMGEAVVVETLGRLQREGSSRHDAIHAVGTVLVDQLLEAMRTKTGGPQLAISYLERLKGLTGSGPRDEDAPAIRIDRFRPEHRDAFAALNRAWLVEHGILEPADEIILDDPEGQLLAPGGAIFVALEGEVVVGTCAIVPHEPAVMELVKLAVDPRVQRQGLGKRLVDACLAFARSRGTRRVMLVSNSRLTAALKLYESVGFQHRPMPPDQPYATADIYMELDLSAGQAAV
jgi:ribosomal protein S18 acetylase RimI-like enzyme